MVRERPAAAAPELAGSLLDEQQADSLLDTAIEFGTEADDLVAIGQAAPLTMRCFAWELGLRTGLKS